MRYALSRLLVVLAVVAGFVALGAYLAKVTLATPQRPVAVVAAMLDTPAGRTLVTDTLTSTLAGSVPGADRSQIRAGVATLVDDPATAAALKSYSSAGTDAGRTAALGTALAPLAASSPTLAAAILAQQQAAQRASPGSDPLEALVPAQFSTILSTRLELLTRVVALASAVAAGSALIALLLGPARPLLLRSLGRAALVASLLELLVLWALPTYLLPRWDSPWSAVLTAGVTAARADLLRVFVALAVGGAVLVAAGYLGGLGQARVRRRPRF